MIELSLDRLGEGLVWQLEMLAAIRRMCITHQIDCGWCAEKERKTAELLRSLRKVIAVRGNVMQIRVKSDGGGGRNPLGKGEGRN